MKAVRGLGSLQASCRANCCDAAYSKAQPFHQAAESEPCCAALHYKQYAFPYFCSLLMNSKVITPHWKYIGAAIKTCSCILVSLSRLKIFRLSSNDLLELQLKQTGFNSLQLCLVQRAGEPCTCNKLHQPQGITGQGQGEARLTLISADSMDLLTSSLICSKIFKKKHMRI